MSWAQDDREPNNAPLLWKGREEERRRACGVGARTRISCRAERSPDLFGGEPERRAGLVYLKTAGCERSGLTLSQTSESDQWDDWL